MGASASSMLTLEQEPTHPLKCRVGSDDVEEAQSDYAALPAGIRIGVDDIGVTLNEQEEETHKR